MPEPVSVELLRIKKLHPTWGAKKIIAVYKRQNNGEVYPGKKHCRKTFCAGGVRRR
jgi:hypothetical protein